MDGQNKFKCTYFVQADVLFYSFDIQDIIITLYKLWPISKN